MFSLILNPVEKNPAFALFSSCNVLFELQPMSMVLPGVVGFKLTGGLKTGVTATDLVLTCTQMLRKHGVVGKFVEFYGQTPLFLLSLCVVLFIATSSL